MMAALARPPADAMPPIRGSIEVGAPLHRFSWFRVGGPAAYLARPEDADDLAVLLQGMPTGVTVTVIGVASNLIIRDGGIDGLVVKLDAPGFRRIDIREDRIIAGAGALDIQVARKARDAGLGGLEFLSGIPGTLGGAVRMNAGAYGREIADILIAAHVIDRNGLRQRLNADELGLSYRHSDLPPDSIVTAAELRAVPGDKDVIAARMAEIQASREATQPIRERTGGSTFANPPGEKAWALIDAAGCRGLRVGGAQVSEKHCNFLINCGDATAADLEALGETVRERVKQTSGIALRWEIRRIGKEAADA